MPSIEQPHLARRVAMQHPVVGKGSQETHVKLSCGQAKHCFCCWVCVCMCVLKRDDYYAPLSQRFPTQPFTAAVASPHGAASLWPAGGHTRAREIRSHPRASALPSPSCTSGVILPSPLRMQTQSSKIDDRRRTSSPVRLIAADELSHVQLRGPEQRRHQLRAW